MRWGWIAFRGLKPACLALFFSLVAALFLQGFNAAFAAAGSPGQLESAWRYWFWLSSAALLVAVGGFYGRLFGWDKEWHGPCQHCGGPLGWLRIGVVMYGNQLPNYRRCWNCTRPNPEP